MKILYITSSFDKKGSASIRNIALVNGLVENNCDVDVLTEYWPDSMVDKSLYSYIDPKVKVFRDHIKLIDFYFLRKKNNERQHKISAIKKIIMSFKDILRQLYFFPDIDKEWISCYKKDLSYSLYDLVISSSDTKTSHFVAKKIVDRYNITWFTYWGDPWEDDKGTRGIKKKIAHYFEKKIVSESDYALYTSEPTLKVMQTRYPEYKNMAFLKRPYLTEICSKNLVEHDLSLSYCGSIYYGRNVNNFLQSIAEYNSNSNSPKINVEFYGVNFCELKEQFENQFIHFHSHVDYKNVCEITKASDALLVFANSHDSHQIPGKLFDYFGTNKCIIVIMNGQQGLVNDFIESTGRCKIIYNNDVNIDMIRNWIIEGSYTPLYNYSPKYVASELLSLYKELS